MNKPARTLLQYARAFLASGPSVRRAALSTASRQTVKTEIRSLLHALSYAIEILNRKDEAGLLDAFVILRNRQDIVSRLMKTAALTEDAGAYLAGITPMEFVTYALDELGIHDHDYTIDRVGPVIRTMSTVFSLRHAVLTRVLLVETLIRMGAMEARIDAEAQATEIRRSISFPPAQKQAAIGVLSYFGEVVARRYPDINVGVTIEQTRERVTLIVQTPQGTEERIEQELESYGRVVTGELSPEAYLNDATAAMALRHKLEIAALEVRQTKQLLESERLQFGARITTLEDHVHFLRTLLSREHNDVHMLAAAIRSVVDAVDPVARAALQRFIQTIESEAAVSKEATDEFIEAARKDRSIISLLQELLLKGAVQGAAGNYLFNFLQAVVAMLR